MKITILSTWVKLLSNIKIYFTENHIQNTNLSLTKMNFKTSVDPKLMMKVMYASFSWTLPVNFGMTQAINFGGICLEGSLYLCTRLHL